MYKVKLTYFSTRGGKSGFGGKYFASGEFISQCTKIKSIWEEIEAMQEMGVLPGTKKGTNMLHVLIDNQPHLLVFVPFKFRKK